MLTYSHWAIRRYKRLTRIHRFNTLFSYFVMLCTVLLFGYNMVLCFIEWELLSVVVVIVVLSFIIGIVFNGDKKLTNEDIERTMANFASGTSAKGLVYQNIPGISESEYGRHK